MESKISDRIKNRLKKKLKKIGIKLAVVFALVIVVIAAIDSTGILDLFGGGGDTNAVYNSSTTCIDGMVYDNPNAPIYKSSSGDRAKKVRDYIRPLLKEKDCEQYIDILVSMCQQESSFGAGDNKNWLQVTGYSGPGGIESVKAGVNFFVNMIDLVKSKDCKDINVLVQCYNYGQGYLTFVMERGGKDTAELRKTFQSIQKKKYHSSIYGNSRYCEMVMSRVTGQLPADTGNNSESLASVNESREKLIAFAEKQIGKPYKYGASGPESFDCSGLVMYCYKKALNISISHSSQKQYDDCVKIDKKMARKGDLVFFSKTKSTKNITHVGIYLGDDMMLEAPRTGLDVRKYSISKHKNCVAYGRFLSTGSDVPLFYQGDSEWGNYTWGGPHVNTLAKSGCGPTSIAMTLSYWTGQRITPKTVAQWCNQKDHYIYHVSSGMSGSLPPAICKAYNVKCKSVGWNSVVSELKKGHIVIASAKPGLFTSAGHIIVLSGISADGKIYVNDPNKNNYSKSNLQDGYKNGFSSETIKNQTKTWWTTYK